MHLSDIIVVALAHPSVALETFDPKCTHPEQTVHVVESVNTRGTLDILLLTLPTLFVCTWTVQHLNIPQKRFPTMHNSMKGKFRASLLEGLPKMIWMVLTIIAPEIIVALAFQDWMLTRRFFEILDSCGDLQNKGWKKAHVFFANMGGFVLTLKVRKDRSLFYDNEKMLETLGNISNIEKELQKCSITESSFVEERLRQILYDNKLKSPIRPSLKKKKPHERIKSSQSHPTVLKPIELRLPPSKVQEGRSGPSDAGTAHDVDEFGSLSEACICPNFPSAIVPQTLEDSENFMRQRKKAPKPKDQETEDITLYLDAIQLYVALKLGLIKELPQIEEEKIMDKSKSDNLVKLYALVQITAFLAHITRRYAKGLPISQLEMAVLAFCFCCFLAYCFYWFKPQSVMVPEDCPQVDYNGETPPRLAIEVDIDILGYFGSIDFIKTTFLPPFCTNRRKPTSPITNDAMSGVLFSTRGIPTHYAEFAAVIAGFTFGALYFMAWAFPFPSKAEMIMWRVASGLTAGGPILYDIANIIMTKLDHGGIRHTIVLYGIAIFYLGARLFLIVEMFRTLLFLPPSTFAS